MGVKYDILPSAVIASLSQVATAADAARSAGSSASHDGQGLAGLCGTAQAVADAVLRLWAQRSETGVRGGDYAAGCAAAVAQACAAISEGDSQMRQTGLGSAGQAASAARFSDAE